MEATSYYFVKDGKKYYDFYRTLNYLKRYAQKRYGPEFKFYKEDEEILYKLYLYFIRDFANCEQRGLDLRKGILLIGPVGCGKTSLMQIFNFLSDTSFTIRPSRDVSAEFITDGFQVLQRYGKTTKIYCFDDLGVEQSIKHFGNKTNVLAEILISRYDYMRSLHLITHATTNLNADELEVIYGNRVRSRLREMFNVISFPKDTPDKRK
jgi:DNA replication protein DnaC